MCGPSTVWGERTVVKNLSWRIAAPRNRGFNGMLCLSMLSLASWTRQDSALCAFEVMWWTSPNEVVAKVGTQPCGQLFLQRISCFRTIGLRRSLQIDYLDSVTDGVQVSRQELGSGQFRWTVTFLDEGDDFELEDPVSRNYLNSSTGVAPIITATKVRFLFCPLILPWPKIIIASDRKANVLPHRDLTNSGETYWAVVPPSAGGLLQTETSPCRLLYLLHELSLSVEDRRRFAL